MSVETRYRIVSPDGNTVISIGTIDLRTNRYIADTHGWKKYTDDGWRVESYQYFRPEQKYG